MPTGLSSNKNVSNGYASIYRQNQDQSVQGIQQQSRMEILLTMTKIKMILLQKERKWGRRRTDLRGGNHHK